MYRTSDSSDLKRYRTEIPNIICTLGLSPYELTLYLHLKRTAGASGECWKSAVTLAKETKMGVASVNRAKSQLEKKRKELNDKPLITILKDESHPGRPRHIISITDIWPENMSLFQKSNRELQTSSVDVQKSTTDVQTSTHANKEVTHKERTNKEIKRVADIILPDWLPQETWQRWFTYRKQIHHPITPIMVNAQIKKLDKLRQAGHAPVEVIEQSIENGWQGLFELKGNQKESRDATLHNYLAYARAEAEANNNGESSAVPSSSTSGGATNGDGYRVGTHPW